MSRTSNMSALDHRSITVIKQNTNRFSTVENLEQINKQNIPQPPRAKNNLTKEGKYYKSCMNELDSVYPMEMGLSDSETVVTTHSDSDILFSPLYDEEIIENNDFLEECLYASELGGIKLQNLGTNEMNSKKSGDDDADTNNNIIAPGKEESIIGNDDKINNVDSILDDMTYNEPVELPSKIDDDFWKEVDCTDQVEVSLNNDHIANIVMQEKHNNLLPNNFTFTNLGSITKNNFNGSNVFVEEGNGNHATRLEDFVSVDLGDVNSNFTILQSLDEGPKRINLFSLRDSEGKLSLNKPITISYSTSKKGKGRRLVTTGLVDKKKRRMLKRAIKRKDGNSQMISTGLEINEFML